MKRETREPSRFTAAERALFAGLVVFVVVVFAIGAAHRAGLAILLFLRFHPCQSAAHSPLSPYGNLPDLLHNVLRDTPVKANSY